MLLSLPWPVWSLLCLGVAALYVIIWPKPKPNRPTPRPPGVHLNLRWFHALVWVWLALACFLSALNWSTFATGAAVLSLLTYVIFLATMGLDRQVNRLVK